MKSDYLCVVVGELMQNSQTLETFDLTKVGAPEPDGPVAPIGLSDPKASEDGTIRNLDGTHRETSVHASILYRVEPVRIRSPPDH